MGPEGQSTQESRDKPHINNHIEGRHNKLGNGLIGQNHLIILHFLGIIAKEQSAVTELERGEPLQNERNVIWPEITEEYDLSPLFNFSRVLSSQSSFERIWHLTISVTSISWNAYWLNESRFQHFFQSTILPLPLFSCTIRMFDICAHSIKENSTACHLNIWENTLLGKDYK